MSISREKMQSLDKRAIEEFGIDSIILMESAALAIFREINNYNSYTVVCGGGNNGGDGLSLARHLILNKKTVDIFIIKEAKSDESKKNLEILKKLTENIFYIKEEKDLENLKSSLEKNEVVVDSIFGVGLDREIKGIYKDVIDDINSFGKFIISVDIPSGLDANTGEIHGVCINANKTIAIHDIKDGMVDSKNCGEIIKVYIGIPGEEFKILK